MTWTSDRTGVLLYTIIGMLIVLSSIYLPARGAVRTAYASARKRLETGEVSAERGFDPVQT